MSDTQKRDEFLRQPHIAVLATVGPDGQPHATPVWYLYEDGVFLIGVERTSIKHRNVRRNPRATLVVDQRERPVRYVMAQGVAEVLPSLTEDVRLRLSLHYLGDSEGREYYAETADLDFVTIVLRPHKFVEMDEG